MSRPLRVSTDSPAFGGIDLVFAGVIVASVLAVYWPVRRFNWVDFDDPQYVFSNPHVLSGLSWQTFRLAFTSHALGLWHPLTTLSYLLDVSCFGPSPGPMHLENVILHASSAVGWYALLLGMTHRRAAAFFAASIFALHPAHVESVAWIAERKDVLSMLMMVLSLIAYWRYTIRSNTPAYVASLVLFAGALMSKPMMVTQPLLMLLLDYWPLGRTRYWQPNDRQAGDSTASRSRLLLEKIPFIVLAAIVSVIAVGTEALSGATPDLQKLSLIDRLATAIVGYLRYLGTACWPKNLAVFYPYQFNVPLGVVAAAALVLMLLTWSVFRFGRRRPYLIVGWIWYVLTLLPVIGLSQAGNQSMADRYAYLPFVGLSLAMVWIISDLAGSSRALRALALMCGLSALLACAAQTRAYLPCWADTVSLFTKAANANGQPDWNIEFHLAEGYNTAGRVDLAIDHYDRALQLNPNQLSAQINLANLLMRYSPAMALPHYQIAVQLSPLSQVAHYDYAACLKALKRDAEAKQEFERAKR